MKEKICNKKGVSMVTVVITVIVVIILASISLVMSDSAIENSRNAKKQTEMAQEKQILEIVYKNSENIFTGVLDENKFRENLKEHIAVIDENYAPEDASSIEYKVIFQKTANEYIVDEDGNITVVE